MVKFVISAAPSNSGVIQEILAQVQVLLKCTGSIGGEGIPKRRIERERGTVGWCEGGGGRVCEREGGRDGEWVGGKTREGRRVEEETLSLQWYNTAQHMYIDTYLP